MVNWFSQTKRKFKIEFRNLKFARRRKLCKNSVFHKRINTVTFILCGTIFIFFCLGSFQFHKCIALSVLSDIDVLRTNVSELKILTRLVTLDIFNRLRRKYFLPENMHKNKVEVWEFSEIRRELLSDFFEKFDSSSTIKNITPTG